MIIFVESVFVTHIFSIFAKVIFFHKFNYCFKICFIDSWACESPAIFLLGTVSQIVIQVKQI